MTQDDSQPDEAGMTDEEWCRARAARFKRPRGRRAPVPPPSELRYTYPDDSHNRHLNHDADGARPR